MKALQTMRCWDGNEFHYYNLDRLQTYDWRAKVNAGYRLWHREYYTGLNDHHDKPIFAGDLVAFTEGKHSPEEVCFGSWDDGENQGTGFYLSSTDGGVRSFGSDSPFSYNGFIVGNIHEDTDS